MTQSPLEKDQLRTAIVTFRQRFDSVLIASSDAEGVPDASYAPYICDHEHNIYILVSQLAQHTGNLLQNRYASLLFIEDESKSGNLFARQRLVYQCRVKPLGRDDSDHRDRLEQMESRFGAIIRTLRALPDFELLQLSPTGGRYIAGFGRAYQWNGAVPDDRIHHLRPGKQDDD